MSYISSKFKKLLSTTSTKLRKELENSEHPKYNYLDFEIDGNKLMLTFVNPVNFEKCGCDSGFTCKLRQKKKPVSLIKQLVTGMDDKSLTDVAARMAAEISSLQDNIKIVSGDEILWVYDRRNYYDEGSETLWDSCMGKPDLNNLMKFYADNPESVSVVYIHKHDKVTARALVWNGFLNKKKVKILDRIYYNTQIQKETPPHRSLFLCGGFPLKRRKKRKRSG